jgi:uncharacterized protein YpmB
MKKEKKFLIIVVVIFVIIVIVFLVGLYFLKNKKSVEPVSLTDAQKIDILNKLGEGVDTSPAAVAKQKEVLKQLSGGKEVKPLTPEEKAKILDSFNNL